jgi:hypothetical protein
MHLAMGEPVQKSARLDQLQLLHDVSIAAARGCGDDVLVEWPRDEDDEDKQIDHGAHCTHGLRAAVM